MIKHFILKLSQSLSTNTSQFELSHNTMEDLLIKDPSVKDHSVGVSQELYDEFMSEIQALKPKKRKQWTRYLEESNGQKTRCKFTNGKIMNWSLIHNRYVQVIALKPNMQKVGKTPLGRLIEAGMPPQKAFDLNKYLNGVIANADCEIDMVYLLKHVEEFRRA